MAKTNIDISALNDNFKKKVHDFEKIFGQRVANGFGAKADMKTVGIDDEITLTREYLANLTQPGLTGKINNKDGDILQYKQRTGRLVPAKVDLYMDELAIRKLRTSFLANKQPADPRDIHSIAGADYIMSRVFAQIGSEVNKSIFRGQLGYGFDDEDEETEAASMFQGGLNLLDGLGIKFIQGYAAPPTAGAIGDIPGANKVTGAAGSLTNANVLAELEKIEEIIYNSPHLEYMTYEDDPEAPDGSLYVNAKTRRLIAIALDNLTYKADKLVEKVGSDYRFKNLPKVTIKSRRWMSGVDNMFFTPNDNLFYLHQDVDADVPKMKFQEVGRGVQILIDWELGVDYADGRDIVLWK